MAIDPSIALSVKPIELPNQLAQYGQVAQILAARDTQQMNALKMQEYERTRAEEEGTRNFLRGQKDLYAPEVRTGLLQFGKTGREFAKGISEQETAAANLKKTGLETDQKAFELEKGKTEYGWRSLGNSPTVEDAIRNLNEGVTKGYFSMDGATRALQQLQQIKTPEDYRQWRINTLIQTMDAKDQVTAMSPKITRQDTGSHLTPIQDNPLMPGYGLPMQGMAPIAKTMTPGEVASNAVALRNAATNAGQLGLAQAKFAFEKANPGYELKEDAAGNLFGVNKRTLQAMPVMVAGAGAPAAAPGAVPAAAGPRVATPAAAPAQVIPGMRSVLDQAVPTAAPAAAPAAAPNAAASTQFRGKQDTPPAKFADTDMQLSGLVGSLKEFKTEVAKKLSTGAKFLPAGADTARMQAKYTALLMGVKDLYALGALAGPDLSIIESQLTNPASWSGKMTTQKGFEEQTQVIEDMVKRAANNLENTYGRQPKATREALKSFGTGGIPGATANDPLGLGLGGR